MKVSGLEGSGDSGTGISTSYVHDAIKLWHRNKPVDPKTGFKRPTIVNMSWGYSTSYDTVSSINYRGTSYSDGTIGSAGLRESNYGLINYYYEGAYRTNVRISSVDTDIEELVDEGVHVLIAAGNRRHKIDTSTGSDYNNYAVTNGGTKYYHRGSSPFHEKAIMVGSLDNNSYSSTQDQKSTFSETGPGIDIWAHGSSIMAASSNTNEIGGYAYPSNNSYKQVAISGTSMATPQVSGVAALIAQANPGITPTVMKAALKNQAGSAVWDGGNNNYDNNRSIQGAPAEVLFNKFGKVENCIEYSGTLDIPLTITF